MNRPVLLDLFCGAGGAAMGYHRAGFHVIGVDINPQPNYPFKFHRADAIHFLKIFQRLRTGESFDIQDAIEMGRPVATQVTAVHASPPCQRYTTLARGSNANVNSYPDLLPTTRWLLDRIGLPYVIENVPAAPMREDVRLCGLSFGLKVFRHRKFELGGWKAEPAEHPPHTGHRVSGWRHGARYEGDMVAVYGDGGGKGSVRDWQDAMGIDWTSVRKEIAESIPPAYTEFIGTQLLEHLTLDERNTA